MVTTKQKLTVDTHKIKERIKQTTKKVTKLQKESREEERNVEEQNSQKMINRMVINTYLSIIILDVNGLNAPIKRHGVAEWIKR